MPNLRAKTHLLPIEIPIENFYKLANYFKHNKIINILSTLFFIYPLKLLDNFVN
jgi:hypothetical protein